jgi:hypothetical protein
MHRQIMNEEKRKLGAPKVRATSALSLLVKRGIHRPFLMDESLLMRWRLSLNKGRAGNRLRKKL